MVVKEIERKFLVKKVPKNLKSYPHKEIVQGYLRIRGRFVRLRKMGTRYFLTKKTGSGLVRDEDERRITKDKFGDLWEKTRGRRVGKTRYLISLEDDLIAELDKYRGSLEGLFTVEVEFETVKEAKVFKPPKWFGKEVTTNARYTNKNLAIEGLP